MPSRDSRAPSHRLSASMDRPMNHGGGIGGTKCIFGKDGHILNEQEKIELWKKQGKCTRCGEIVTHKKNRGRFTVSFFLQPITVEGMVYKGYCLRCYTLNEARIQLGEPPIDEPTKTKKKHGKSKKKKTTARQDSHDSEPEPPPQPPRADGGGTNSAPPIGEIVARPGWERRDSASTLGMRGISQRFEQEQLRMIMQQQQLQGQAQMQQMHQPMHPLQQQQQQITPSKPAAALGPPNNNGKNFRPQKPASANNGDFGGGGHHPPEPWHPPARGGHHQHQRRRSSTDDVPEIARRRSSIDDAPPETAHTKRPSSFGGSIRDDREVAHHRRNGSVDGDQKPSSYWGSIRGNDVGHHHGKGKDVDHRCNGSGSSDHKPSSFRSGNSEAHRHNGSSGVDHRTASLSQHNRLKSGTDAPSGPRSPISPRPSLHKDTSLRDVLSVVDEVDDKGQERGQQQAGLPAGAAAVTNAAGSASSSTSSSTSSTPQESDPESGMVKMVHDHASVGNCRGVLEMIKTNPSMKRMVKAACEQLRTGVPAAHHVFDGGGGGQKVSSSSSPAAGAMLPPSWVKILLQASSASLKDASVQSEVFFTLWTISTVTPRYMSDVAECGGVEAMLKAIDKWHGSDPAVVRNCCGALACLAGSERHCTLVRSSPGDVVGRMVKVVTGRDTPAIEWALRALFNLSVHAPSGRVAASVSAEKKKAAGVGATSVTRKRSVGEEMLDLSPKRGGGAGTILDVLHKHGGDDSGVAEWAIRLLWSLSGSENGGGRAVVVASMDMIDTITSSMGKHKQSASLQEAACSSLSNLAVPPPGGANANGKKGNGTGSKGEISASMARSIAEAVVQSMREHAPSVAVQLSGCRALSSVCSSGKNDPENRTMVAQLGGINVILAAMDRFIDVAALQGAACTALANLCIDAEWNKHAVASAGGIQTIVAALRRHVIERGMSSLSTRDVQLVGNAACTALATLAVSPQNMAILTSSGVMDELERLVNAMDGSSIPETLQSSIRDILSSGLNDTESTGGHAGAVFMVVEAMKSRTRVEEVEQAMESLHRFSYSSKDCVDAIVLCDDEGGEGLGHVLKAMQSFPGSARVQEHGCGLLSNVYANIRHNRDVNDSVMPSTRSSGDMEVIPSKVKISIRTSKEIDVILNAMRNHRPRSDVQARACMALRNFCAASSFPVMSHDGVESALMSAMSEVNQAMMSHPESLSVQESACGVLWALSDTSTDLATAVGSSDAIQYIADAMEEFSNEEVLINEACGALWALSSSPENFAEEGSERGVDLIIDRMNRDGADATCVEKAISAIASLSADHYAVKVIILENEVAIRCIIDCMYQFPQNAVIQTAACTAIANLSVDNYIKNDIASQGGVDRVVNAMRQLSRDALVVEKACEALCNLISGVPDAILTGNDTIRFVIESMQVHPDCVAVQEKGMGALWNMSVKSEGNKEKIAKIRGIEVIVNAMREHIESETLQEKGCVVLWSLSVYESNQREIGDCGGVQVIFNSMMAHIKNPAIQLEALGAVKGLASNPRNKAIIGENDGIDVIVWVMWVHHENTEIQTAACTALTNIAVNVRTNQVALVAENELNSVTSAMGRHPTSQDVQESACLLLRNYTFAPSNARILKECERLPELLRIAATNFPDSCGERANYVMSCIT